MKKLTGLQRMSLGDSQLKKIERDNTVEILAKACVSGICHNDTSRITELVELQNKRTRLGRDLSERLPHLAKTLKDVVAGRSNSLPPLPTLAVHATGKLREPIVKDWALAVARSTILAAEAACKSISDAAKREREVGRGDA